MQNNILVVKIGGNIINDEEALDAFLSNFASIKQPKILVHGGGKTATQLSKTLGIKTQMHEGRRITSTENLEVVTMVYAGLLNKKIVAKLQAKNCNALGVSGADCNMIQAQKRPVDPIDFGWVGDVQTVNANAIKLFIDNNITPVFCAISHNKKGQLLNTNADTIASEVAVASSQFYNTQLVYCFEKKGVLKNANDDDSVIQHIDYQKFQTLKQQQIITDGMLPKMHNCFNALKGGVEKVFIGNPEVIIDKSFCTTVNI